MPAAAAQEGVPGPVHQARDLRRFGGYRERARVDAPDIQQVADQAAHVIGLLVDDAEELSHLGRVELRSGVQRGGGRTLDRGQRRAQLVAHHAQELGPQALQLLERRQVLQGDHHRLDRAVRRTDRRRVDQRGHAPPVRDRELDLLRAHRLGVAELVGERELVKPGLAPVASPADHDLQQLLGWAVPTAQPPDDPPRLAVERHRTAGRSIEHHHPDRRGVDQGLQVGPGPLLVAVRAGVGDRRRRLRGEQHQDLPILLRELLPTLLLAEKEVADMHPPVLHRHGLQGLRQRQLLGIAERADVGGHVRQPQRARKGLEVFEELVPVRPLRHVPALVRRQAGGDELLDRAGVVDGRDHAVAGAGQRAGAVDDLAQDGVEVEARADAQDRRAEHGDAFAQRRVLLPQFVGTVHPSILPGPARRTTGFEPACRTRCAGPNQGPRRDAPVPTMVPMTAAHGATGAGIYPEIHGNATEVTQLFTSRPHSICIILRACTITSERGGDPLGGHEA